MPPVKGNVKAPRVGAKNGPRAKKADEELRTKQDLLNQLTRQAEENTRILERERAALLAMGIDTMNLDTAAMQAQALEAPFAVDPQQTAWQAPQPQWQQGADQHTYHPTHQQDRPHEATRYYHGHTPPRRPPQPVFQPQELNLPKLKMKPQKQHGPIQAHINRTHNFLNKPGKVVDVSQVPGLGGDGSPGAQHQPHSPFFGHDDKLRTPGPGSTFPDSPSFYPGMVFSIPMAATPPVDNEGAGRGGSSQPDQQQPQLDQQGAAGAQPQQAAGRFARGQVGKSQLSRVSMPGGPAAPPAGALPRVSPRGVGLAGGSDAAAPGALQGLGARSAAASEAPYDAAGRRAARLAQESKQEAYRRELEEQIRARKAIKEAEAASTRELGPSLLPLAPGPPQQGRGVAGQGHTLSPTNHQQHGGFPVGPSPPHNHSHSPPPPHQHSPPPLPTQDVHTGLPTLHNGALQPTIRNGAFGRRNAPRLTVDLPSDPPQPHQQGPGSQAMWPLPAMPAQGPLPPLHAEGSFQLPPPWQQQHGQPQQPTGWIGPGPPPWDPAWAAGGRRQSDPAAPQPAPGEPHSPGAMGRRFMGAMAQLRAGPSEEQQQHAAQARAQLLRDLDEQVRQKKEREARKKAEEEAIRAKEEAELAAYYQRLAEQKEEEKRAAREDAVRREAAAAATRSMGGAAAADPEPVAHPHRPRRGNKKLIDADWLNNASPPAHAAHANATIAHGNAGHVTRVVRHDPVSGGGSLLESVHETSHGGARHVRHTRQNQQGDGVSVGGAAPRGGDQAGVGAVLSVLQQEQVRIREEFARQAASLEQLTHSAGVVAADRAQAWRDVQRVRGALAAPSMHSGGGAGPGHHGLDTSDQDDFDRDQFVVSTHLLPRDANSIPTRLCTPLEAEWAAAREPLLVHKGPAPRDAAAAYSFAHPAALAMEDAAEMDQLYRNPAHHNQPYTDQHAYAQPHNADQDDSYPDAHAPMGPAHAPGGPMYGRKGSAVPGLYRPVSRVVGPPSQIPRPPGQRQAWGAPAGASRGGAGAVQGRQGASRYNSFFGLNDEGYGGGGLAVPQQRQQGAGGGRMQSILEGAGAGPAGGRAPAVAFGRRAVARPPPSPAILRGDHLPSPDRKMRVPQSAAPLGKAARVAPVPPRGASSARRFLQARRGSAAGDAPPAAGPVIAEAVLPTEPHVIHHTEQAFEL